MNVDSNSYLSVRIYIILFISYARLKVPDTRLISVVLKVCVFEDIENGRRKAARESDDDV